MLLEAEVAAVPVPARIAGFWRRTAAFLVDGLLLGGASWLAGLLFYDQLVAAEGWPLLVGAALYLAYFVPLDSRFGPSPGKRLLKVRVVDAAGGAIPLGRSTLRCLILGIPLLLNRAQLPASITGNVFLMLLDGLIVFGWGGVLLYLYLFNRTTRQSLHDLLTGTFVVDAGGESLAPAAIRLPKLHGVVAGVWFALAVAWFGYFGVRALSAGGRESTDEFVGLEAAQRAVLGMPGVVNVAVYQEGLSPGSKPPAWFQVTARVGVWPQDLEVAAREVVARSLAAGIPCSGNQRFFVAFSRGFSLGITSSWRNQRVVHTCEEWMAEPAASEEGDAEVGDGSIE